MCKNSDTHVDYLFIINNEHIVINNYIGMGSRKKQLFHDNLMRENKRITAGADGGPRPCVCACVTLR